VAVGLVDFDGVDVVDFVEPDAAPDVDDVAG